MTRAIAVFANNDNESRTEWEIDPGDYYLTHDPASVLESAGLIPSFVNAGDKRPPEVQMAERYPYFYSWDDADDDTGFGKCGRMFSKGDSPLDPLVKTVVNGDAVYVYPYGIVAIIRSDGSAIWTRMD